MNEKNVKEEIQRRIKYFEDCLKDEFYEEKWETYRCIKTQLYEILHLMIS